MASLKEHLIIALNTYIRNFTTLFFSIIIMALVSLIFIIPASFFLTSGIERLPNNETFQNSLNFQSLFLFSSVGIGFALVILGLLVVIYLSSGFVGLCYYGIKKRVYLNTFLEVIKKRGTSYFLTTAIVGLIFSMILTSFTIFLIALQLSENIIILFLWIIMLLILPFFVLYGPAVISGKTVINSIEQSIKLGANNYVGLFVLSSIFVAASLVNIISIPIIEIILTLVNYLLIMPLFQITLCSIYIDKTKVKSRRRGK